VSERAKPFVLLAGRPAVERATEAWGAGVLLALMVAVNDDGLSTTGLMLAIMTYGLII